MNAVAQHAKEVFLELVGHVPPDQWDERLAQLCAGDADLARRVAALLKAHRQPDQRLDQPAVEIDWDLTANGPLTERTGMMIGPYKLLEELGEGGFGVVFMAEQAAPMRRRVALKVLKPGMDTRQVVARFEAERQALALMDHPHIARVLDGGETPSGRPYFVMELVRGIPITDFCDRNHLSVRERLALFTSVCHAVQHAHQKGVIHRDMKPSNVLVTLHDGVPVAKVIDFGIAKAAGQQLTEKTLFTNYAQMIGTPLYMSPEQAELSGLDVDTRSDIYSLGVLLYELLTGTTPFDKERLKAAGYDEMRRLIREEEPARPSDRISTLGQAAATISANRGSDPRRLGQLCRGELDWIVMKALEKDRNRRYESASAFAADVQRYLADEPVLACPPSPWYRIGKFARRNKGIFATGGTIAAALVLAVASLVGAVSVLAGSNAEIQAEQEQTQQALDGEKKANDKLLDVVKREQRTLYLKRIALAERELSANNFGRLDEMLEECPLHLRGWEWNYLRRGRGPLTFEGHKSWVFGVAFSPDGKLVASAGKQGDVKLWDRATGKEVHSLLGHEPPACAVAFRPDGKQLASAGWDGTIRIWNVETGEQLASLTDHPQRVTSVAYSPDGKLLASAGGDRLVLIWDAATLQRLRTLQGPTKSALNVAFAPDSRRLAASGNGEPITVWDAITGQEIYSIPGDKSIFERVTFSRDGQTLVSNEFNGTVIFWDAATGRHRFTIHTYPGTVGLALSPDGRRMATAGFERTVNIWDVETSQEALSLRGHTEMVYDLAFSADGQQLASASMDGTVRIWDAGSAPVSPSKAESLTLRGFPIAVMGVAFHPDNQRLATASLETVQLWNAATGAEMSRLPGHSGIASSVVFSRDGKTLAAATFSGVIKVWDVEIAREVRTFRGSGANVALSPDGQRVAAVIGGGFVHMWDTATGKEALPPFRVHQAHVHGICFSPDGQYLATASWDTTAALWNATTGQKVQTFRGHTHVVMQASFSADGKRLATASLDKTAKIWDIASGQELLTIGGHDDRVISVAFSPDGQLLATGSWDNTAKVWDAATGKEIETLRGHSGYVFSVAFSPDGNRLATAGGYRSRGEVKLWNTADWKPKNDP